MNPKHLFITLSCLLFFAANGVAQQKEQPATPTQDELLQKQMEALESHFQRSFAEAIFRQHWNSQGVSQEMLTAMGDPVIRAAWGISEEQNQQAETRMITSLERKKDDIPESFVFRVQTDEETGQVMTSLALRDFNITPAELQAAAEKITALMMDATVDALHEVLTQEQWQKINESQLANMEEMPMFSLNIFEALDLTDAQREQMEQSKKELEPEFEKTLENWVNGILIMQKKVDEARGIEGMMDGDAIREKLMAEDPEYQRIYEDIQAQGRAFATKFKVEMFDVLTDEQWERMLNLIDNPPEHALVFRKALKKQSGENEADKETEKVEVWQPGPNSWRPGDPIPEEYRLKRNERSRFSRETKRNQE